MGQEKIKTIQEKEISLNKKALISHTLILIISIILFNQLWVLSNTLNNEISFRNYNSHGETISLKNLKEMNLSFNNSGKQINQNEKLTFPYLILIIMGFLLILILNNLYYIIELLSLYKDNNFKIPK